MTRVRSIFRSTAPFIAAAVLALLMLPAENNNAAVKVVKWWGEITGEAATISDPPNSLAVSGILDSDKVRTITTVLFVLSLGVAAIVRSKRT